MNEINLRYQAVQSLRRAIDLDHEDKAVEAYLKYLEGLSLVVTALQKDAINGGKWVITDKDRRSMVNFAKESIERITLLLKRQDEIAEKEDVKEESPVNNPTSPNGTKSLSPISSQTGIISSNTIEPLMKALQPESKKGFSGPSFSESQRLLPSRPLEDNVLFVDAPLSPIDAMRLENNNLTKKYAQRVINAPLAQKPQLRLELERRIAENMAIAESKQQLWEAERERAVQHYRKLSERKCRRYEKSKVESQDPIVDPSLQEAIYSCYMFEWERKFRSMNCSVEIYQKPAKVSSPEATGRALRKSMDLATRALRGSIRGHPLGSLLVQKQQSVCRRINKLLTSHDFSRELSAEPKTFLANLGNEETGLMCTFNQIAEGIKSDLDFLEKTILSLYESLETEEGCHLLSQTLQKIYFPAITPSMRELLRLCVSTLRVSPPEGFEVESRGEGASVGSTSPPNSVLNSSEVEARFRLQSLQSLSSPCEKLDCLMEVMRSLCSWKFGSSDAADKETTQAIGADDLLSRLVAVIHGGEESSHGELVKLLQMETVFLQAFVPDDMMLGEAGYCVTVLCSVLSV